MGVGKVLVFLSGSSSSSLVRCVFKSADGWSSNPCPWSESECRPNPIPHPMIWGNSHTSTSQESLPCADGFLEQLLTYSDLPMSPKFPSLTLVLYWDLYNYLCYRSYDQGLSGPLSNDCFLQVLESSLSQIAYKVYPEWCLHFYAFWSEHPIFRTLSSFVMEMSFPLYEAFEILQGKGRMN